MQSLDALEDKIDKLLGKIRDLEEENSNLRSKLNQERESREIVLKRLDNLLQKIDEVDIT